MDLRRLSEDMTVSDQITAEDIATLSAAGVTTLIINRPDAEVDPALASAEMMRFAEAAGMTVRYVPYSPGQINGAMIDAFADAAALPGNAHAYCRSGTRSTHLWALSQAGVQPVEAIIESAARAGYDIAALAPLIAHRAG